MSARVRNSETNAAIPKAVNERGEMKGDSAQVTARYGSASGRKPTVLILVAILFMSLIVPEISTGADDAAVKKFVGRNWVNGRSWEKLDYAGKLGFVCGIFDGITLFWSLADNEKSRNRSDLNGIYNSLSVPSSFTVGDIVKGMDEFYKDEVNVELPAICAYMFYVSTSRGDSPASVKKRLGVWRRMFKQ